MEKEQKAYTPTITPPIRRRSGSDAITIPSSMRQYKRKREQQSPVIHLHPVKPVIHEPQLKRIRSEEEEKVVGTACSIVWKNGLLVGIEVQRRVEISIDTHRRGFWGKIDDAPDLLAFASIAADNQMTLPQISSLYFWYLTNRATRPCFCSMYFFSVQFFLSHLFI